MNKFLSLLALIAGLAASAGVRSAEPGDAVIVVYNTRVPDSKAVAEYYTRRRHVPTGQVFGFDLPVTETMTRAEFNDQLQRPLLKKLEEKNLFALGAPSQADNAKALTRKLIGAKIRYAVLCFGVPVKILRDPALAEDGTEQMRAELRRNEAAVDSELAWLPMSEQRLPLSGPMTNPVYGTTNAAQLHPTHGILMVARLDGPSAPIARGLVDKALEAETNGLWGRAYFDLRGIGTGEYKQGDEWIGGAAETCRRYGFETVVDVNPGTFPAGFPMSQIALYAGWYDGDVSGPFARPTVEFMPGAFAYHLHSFSAHTLRDANVKWVGPLLAKGVTATMGSVEEPFLTGTPDVATFFGRFLLLGFSFGEAAYAAQSTLSWQTTVIGDPLYRPFARKSQELHEDLQRRGSKLTEWSHLRVVNLNIAQGFPTNEVMRYLVTLPELRQSAVLLEKLGDLLLDQVRLAEAVKTYDQALKTGPSPQQRIRLLLTLARLQHLYGRDEAVYGLYRQLVKEFPEYPDLLAIYQKLLPLAETLAKKEDADKYQQEIKRLTTPAAKP